MGHAYEAISADIIARYHRNAGRDVFFCTGTDEHGMKIARTAEEQSLTPLQLCDHYVAKFQELNAKLLISNDRFIRTTEQQHKDLARLIFQRALDGGDIYKDTYEGWYNVREEKFVTETEAAQADFKDSVSGKPLTKMQEESYFFKMSKYQAQLIEYIKTHPEFIQPEERRHEILDRLSRDKLQDLSVSRTTFSWGVPLPNDPKHVMYVWFDALSNYLSAVDYPHGDRARYWPANMHLIGKDIVWFHTVIWPCMLFSANVPLPRTVFCHGFINGPDGKKMSKSIGNVVDPWSMLDKYPVDSFRFFLLREGSFGSDINFVESNLIERHNSELCDGLYNLINRTLNLAKTATLSRVPDVTPVSIFDLHEFVTRSEEDYARFRLQETLERLWLTINTTNKFLNDRAPWKDKDTSSRQVTIRSVLEAIYILAHYLEPILPDSALRIFAALHTPKRVISKLSWNNLAVDTQLEEKYSFTKIENKLVVLPIQRVELRVGQITSVAPHPEAEKLYVLQISLGATTRQIVSGLRDFFTAEQLLNKHVVIVANLKPAKFKGVQSQGMLLTAEHVHEGQTTLVLIQPPAEAPLGDMCIALDKPAQLQGELKIQALQKIALLVKDQQVTADGLTVVAQSNRQPLRADIADGAKVK
jgi:methionyl-tRNA synthetase